MMKPTTSARAFVFSELRKGCPYKRYKGLKENSTTKRSIHLLLVHKPEVCTTSLLKRLTSPDLSTKYRSLQTRHVGQQLS
jgi:hypothetical protein